GAGMILGPGGSGPAQAAEGDGRGVSLADRERRLGQRAATVLITGGDPARRADLGYALERHPWDEGYTAHLLAAPEAAVPSTCQRLGLITIVLEGAAEGAVVVPCNEGASVEAALNELRARGAIG